MSSIIKNVLYIMQFTMWFQNIKLYIFIKWFTHGPQIYQVQYLYQAQALLLYLFSLHKSAYNMSLLRSLTDIANWSLTHNLYQQSIDITVPEQSELAQASLFHHPGQEDKYNNIFLSQHPLSESIVRNLVWLFLELAKVSYIFAAL